MNYTRDEFDLLLLEVEAQGGALLPDPCVPLDVKFTKPPYARNYVDKRSTCGCGNESRFVTEYDNGTNAPGFITACAVCDGMGHWPRYKEALA